MSAKHTPGEWRHVTCQRPFGGEPWEVVEDSDGNPLGEFYGDVLCDAANARLAAAAPDLLAALRACVEGYADTWGEDCPLTIAARAAIAKAERAE